MMNIERAKVGRYENLNPQWWELQNGLIAVLFFWIRWVNWHYRSDPDIYTIHTFLSGGPTTSRKAREGLPGFKQYGRVAGGPGGNLAYLAN